MLHVPIVDLAPFYSGDAEARKRVAEKMDQVCQDIGFLVVTGHPIDLSLMQAVQDVSLEFFALPETEKRKLKSPIEGGEGLRGYGPMMDESLSHSIGVKAPGDIKETVTIGPPGASEARYLMAEDYYCCDEAHHYFVPMSGPIGRTRCAHCGKNISARWTSFRRNSTSSAPSLSASKRITLSR